MLPKILLVDDREDNLLSMGTILEQDNYEIVRANSGKQALKVLLKEYDFALILMDVKMPNMNGFETAALIYEREKLRHIPIVFITAHNYGEENIFQGYRAGAVDYISKPINPQLLRAKVAVFVDLYQKNHRLVLQEQKLITINKSLEIEINERKASEEKVNALNLELVKSVDRLEVANKELDRFAFMASHDLQEPLRKIRWFSERLLSTYEKVLDEDGMHCIKRIQKAAERMNQLIKAILTFSKISTDESLLVETDLHLLLDDVLIELSNEIKEKKAEITISKLPALMVNPVLIQALFYNLISNALKYSRKDILPLVKIRFENSASDNQNNGFCRISVEDNGIGFDQKYAEQIFEMFKRLHGVTQYEGTGIGLALCKKIVELHKGYISARSSENEGSTFTISLPVNLSQLQPGNSKVFLEMIQG